MCPTGAARHYYRKAREYGARSKGCASSCRLRAMWVLLDHPKFAVSKLQTELQPASRMDPKIIMQAIAEIDDKSFKVRERAIDQLKKAGEAAWPALRALLANPPSLEAQARARLILGNHDDPLLPSAGRLRSIRSLEVLERLPAGDVRPLIQSLTQCDPEAWLTREAARILKTKGK
jgi:hypothetical protein